MQVLMQAFLWFICEQSSRKVRSHIETEEDLVPKGPVGKITPAVSASERRKSLTLVSGNQDSRQKKNNKKTAVYYTTIWVCGWWIRPDGIFSGLFTGLCALSAVPVSSTHILWLNPFQDPSAHVEQHFHWGESQLPLEWLFFLLAHWGKNHLNGELNWKEFSIFTVC